MLIKITTKEALDMLIDPEQFDKVYFKDSNKYLMAKDYKWEFEHGINPVQRNHLPAAEFYKEVEA